jgi:phenylacetate-CoA ligase
MFIFRAVNIYPSTIDKVISEVEGLGSEFQVHLSRDAAERDVMRLIVERAENSVPGDAGELGERLLRRIKRQVMVTPAVEVVDYGTLPRSERKSQRVFDNRIIDSIL